jgi:hypothetical protein
MHQITEMEMQIARFSMTIENHKQKIVELEQSFKDESATLGNSIQIFADAFSTSELIRQQKEEIIKRKIQVEAILQEAKMEVHQREQYFGRELRELSTGLNNAKFRRTNLVSEVEKYRQQINNRRLCSQRQQELMDELTSLYKKVKLEKEDLDLAEEALNEFIAASNESEKADTLNELRTAAQIRLGKLSKMHSEMEFYKKIIRMREEKDFKQEKSDHILNDNIEKFREIQGEIYDKKTLIRDIDLKIQGQDELRHELRTKEKSLEDLEVCHRFARTAEAIISKNRQEFRKMLNPLAGDMLLSEAISELEREINEVQKIIRLTNALSVFAVTAMDLLGEEHTCFGCKRLFNTDEEKKHFLIRMNIFEKADQREKIIEARVTFEQKAEKLRKLQLLTLWDERLRKEEEDFQSKYNLDELERNISQLKSEIHTINNELNNLDDLSNLKKTAENMIELEAELENLFSVIIDSEVNLADSGSTSDPVHTMNELQDLEQRISKLQDEKDKIQKVRIAKMQQVSQYTKIYQSRQDQITARERQLKDVSEKMTLAEEAEELSKRAQCEKEVRI